MQELARRDRAAQARDRAVRASASTSPTPRPARSAATRSATRRSCAWSRSRPISPRSTRSGRYRGRYHVLGGAFAPIDGVGPEELRDRASSRRACGAAASRRWCSPPTRTPRATPPPTTCSDRLRPLGVRLTRIAYGMPLGGDLEYADHVTVGACASRTAASNLRVTRPRRGAPKAAPRDRRTSAGRALARDSASGVECDGKRLSSRAVIEALADARHAARDVRRGLPQDPGRHRSAWCRTPTPRASSWSTATAS